MKKATCFVLAAPTIGKGMQTKCRLYISPRTTFLLPRTLGLPKAELTQQYVTVLAQLRLRTAYCEYCDAGACCNYFVIQCRQLY